MASRGDETRALTDVESRSGLDSYDLWERGQWTIAELDLAADREGWGELPPFVAYGLHDAMDRFFLGESAVTETLSPIVHAAPSAEAQIFLATQLADEARHTLFFARYVTAVGAHDASAEPLKPYVRRRWESAPEPLQDLLDRDLREVTGRLASGGDPADWYRAVAVYHLVVEGVLAVAGQRALLHTVRRYPKLSMLETGLRGIARDESRHIAFGVGALRDGVRSGFGDAIAEAVQSSVKPAVWTLVAPERPLPRLIPESAKRSIAETTERQWRLVLGALVGRLRRIELERAATDTEATWAREVESALDEYGSRHDRPHPVREVLAGVGS